MAKRMHSIIWSMHVKLSMWIEIVALKLSSRERLCNGWLLQAKRFIWKSMNSKKCVRKWNESFWWFLRFFFFECSHSLSNSTTHFQVKTKMKERKKKCAHNCGSSNQGNRVYPAVSSSILNWIAETKPNYCNKSGKEARAWNRRRKRRKKKCRDDDDNDSGLESSGKFLVQF